jgi:hypothetical protein
MDRLGSSPHGVCSQVRISDRSTILGRRSLFWSGVFENIDEVPTNAIPHPASGLTASGSFR